MSEIALVNDLCRIPEQWIAKMLNMPLDIVRYIMEVMCGYTHRNGVYVPKLRILPPLVFGELEYMHDEDVYVLQFTIYRYHALHIISHCIVSQINDYVGMIYTDVSDWGYTHHYYDYDDCHEFGTIIYTYNNDKRTYELLENDKYEYDEFKSFKRWMNTLTY